MNYTVTREALKAAKDVATLLGAYVEAGLSLEEIVGSATSSWDKVQIGYRTYSVSSHATMTLSAYTGTLVRQQPRVSFDLRIMCLQSLERFLTTLETLGTVTLTRDRSEPLMVYILTGHLSVPDTVITMGLALAALHITSINLDSLYTDPLHLRLQ